jgi:manganese transport protein
MSFFEYLGEGHWLIKCLILLIITICATVLIYIFIKPFVASSNTSAPTSLHGEVETNLQLIAQKSYKHIAITVDFSSRDQKTMQHALSLGGKKATYLLIHVVETAGAFRLGKDILDSETQYDELGLKKYEEQLGALGYIVETRLGYGKSAKAITEIVNATDADLLVMGAHGHKAIKDIVLGSTVDWVRHEVRVPVLIVN